MPALDALQAKLGGPDFEVVAVNIDTRDPQKPLAFLKEVGVTHLAYYSDQSAHVFEDLKAAGKAFGMPTTVIVDRSGCEIGNMAGPAEWSSDDGIKLVSAAIATPNDRFDSAAERSNDRAAPNDQRIPAFIALRGHVQFRFGARLLRAGERTDILLRGVDQFHHRGTVLLVHARHVRRHGKLRRAGLRRRPVP